MSDKLETTIDPLADLDLEPEPERCAYCGKVLPVIGTYGGQPIYGHVLLSDCPIEGIEKATTDGVP